MNNALKFSIIIPTFNRAHLIDTALSSILSQSFSSFEILVVDDGSSDNTKQVVLGYSDPRIHYHNKDHEERNIARNYGMSLARGDYVGFLDSDDLLYPNHLQAAKELIDAKDSPEVVHLNYEIATSTGTISSEISGANANEINHILVDENLCHCNSLFVRSDIAKKFQFLTSQNAVVGEDYCYFLRLACRYKFHTNPMVTNAVVLHKDRSLNRIDVKKLRIGTREIRDELSSDAEFMQFYGWKAKRYFSRNYIFLALHLAMNGRRLESLRFLAKAIEEHTLSLVSRRFLAVLKQLFKTRTTVT